MMNRNTVDAQARWARAFHRRVTGSQIRLANTTPATAAARLDCDTPSSFSPPATTAARTAVPTTASTNRRMADQAPALAERCLPGRNNEAEPTGAATIAASNNVSSMPALTLHFRAVLLTSPGGSMRAGAEYGRGRTGQAVGTAAAAPQQAGVIFRPGPWPARRGSCRTGPAGHAAWRARTAPPGSWARRRGSWTLRSWARRRSWTLLQTWMQPPGSWTPPLGFRTRPQSWARPLG